MEAKSTRRRFVKTSILGGIAGVGMLNTSFNIISINKPEQSNTVGHGDFQYMVDKAWGNQDPNKFPVIDCHEMVKDKAGRLILLNTHTKNNVLIYDRSGKVLDIWGTEFPGAHGLTLWNANGEEFLFITDQIRNQVF